MKAEAEGKALQFGSERLCLYLDSLNQRTESC